MKRVQTRHIQGFTIIELLVTALILSVILGIVLSTTTSSLSLYQTDQARNGAIRNARSTFDVLSQDIQQAGERLGSDFPAITITKDASGNSVLTLRRGLAEGPMPLCAPIPSSGTIYVNANNPNHSSFGTVSDLGESCTANLQNLGSWDAALIQGGTIGMVINMDKANRTSDFFKIREGAASDSTTEQPKSVGTTTDTANQQTINFSASGLPTRIYDPRKINAVAPAPDIRVYLLEDRVYSVANGQLVLDQNSTGPQPATPQVLSLTVTPYVKPVGGITPDSPALAQPLPFPPAPDAYGDVKYTWKDLAYLEITLNVKDNSGNKSATKTLNVQVAPRNASSGDSKAAKGK